MRIVNENVVLRAIEKSDNDLFKELINDPEVENKIVGWSFPVSDEKQMQWYQSITDNDNLDHVRYAVEVDGKCVGMAALHEIDYKNSNAGVDIKLTQNARGKGIGSKVINALVQYAFNELNIHCLVAEILEDNINSRKLFEKCGFIMEGKLRDRIYKGGRYCNLYIYSILKP